MGSSCYQINTVPKMREDAAADCASKLPFLAVQSNFCTFVLTYIRVHTYI